MRNAPVLFLAIASLTFFAGCKKETASNSPAASPTPPVPGGELLAVPAASPTPVVKTIAATPDLTMTTEALSKEWQEGSQSALNTKYGGKTIQLTGVVQQFTSGSNGPHFEIAGHGLIGVDLYPQNMKDWEKVAEGNTITARGVFTKNLEFNPCVLVKAEGTPAPAMTSKELAAAYYADPYKFNDNYQRRSANTIVNHLFRIDGKVVAKQVGKSDHKQLVLEGTDDQHLVPLFLQTPARGAGDPNDAVKIGQHVTVYGDWWFPAEGQVKEKKEAMIGEAVILPE